MEVQSNQIKFIRESLNNIVTKFLSSSGDFHIGLPFTEHHISRMLNSLDKAVDVDLLPVDYKIFLTDYGHLYGENYNLCSGGPFNIYEQIARMVVEQKQFQFVFKEYIEEKDLKYCWLVGSINYHKLFYLNLSTNGNGRVYTINRGESYSMCFAKNFLGFFDTFYECYDSKKVERKFRHYVELWPMKSDEKVTNKVEAYEDEMGEEVGYMEKYGMDILKYSSKI